MSSLHRFFCLLILPWKIWVQRLLVLMTLPKSCSFLLLVIDSCLSAPISSITGSFVLRSPLNSKDSPVARHLKCFQSADTTSLQGPTFAAVKSYWPYRHLQEFPRCFCWMHDLATKVWENSRLKVLHPNAFLSQSSVCFMSAPRYLKCSTSDSKHNPSLHLTLRRFRFWSLPLFFFLLVVFLPDFFLIGKLIYFTYKFLEPL